MIKKKKQAANIGGLRDSKPHRNTMISAGQILRLPPSSISSGPDFILAAIFFAVFRNRDYS
jgi:hypothetical protein